MMNSERRLIEAANSVKVLLVDDDVFYLELLESQLKILGISLISTCSSSPGLFEALEREHPELIVLDINMPDMDGIELLRKLGEAEYRGAIAIISGEDTRIMDTAAKLAKAYKLDLVACLSKPVSLGRLEETIRKCKLPDTSTSISTAHQYSAEDISNAINRRELVNYYQPQVRTDDCAFVGIETLVRWQHPKHGLILPDQFIGIAEENGLITSLTDLVVETAISQAREWQESGIQTRVSVNVSMDDLLELDFPDKLEASLSAQGVPPIDFAVELTESKLMSNVTAWLDILTRLRLKRVGLSIDDFGTGHSSLSKLSDLPFSELKIDKSFVRKAHSDETLSAIFSGSQNIAELLNMQLVAEGVEDIEDWHWVQERNCELAQGYFIARPMPAEKIPAWIEDWQARKVDLIQQSPPIGEYTDIDQSNIHQTTALAPAA